MDFALHLPLNGVSFGQVSVALCREIYAMGLNPAIFTIGQPDLRTQNIAPDFGLWLNSGISKAMATHKRTTPIIKLWHLNGGLESLSIRQILFTFYELDNPTKEEINAVKNNDKVFFSSSYARDIFSDVGCKNVDAAPLGFDKHNFSIINKQYHNDGRITFNLCGKLEKRKHHVKTISAWVKKYGGNPKFYLKCAVQNPFIQDVEQQKAILVQACGGTKPFNVEFVEMMKHNLEYNDFLNSGDIVIGMSGGEGWGLPEFQSVALGKHAVILAASGYKSWANEQNSVLVHPCGKVESYDNFFFHKGQPFNQGNIYDFDDSDFIAACEKAIERVKADKLNIEGVRLQQNFSYRSTVEKLLGAI